MKEHISQNKMIDTVARSNPALAAQMKKTFARHKDLKKEFRCVHRQLMLFDLNLAREWEREVRDSI